MELIGGIVKLRAIEEKDMGILKELLNDPEIEEMTLGKNFPVSEYSQKKWYENYKCEAEVRYMVEINSTAETIGTIGLINIDWLNRNAMLFIKVQNDKKGREIGDVKESFELLLEYAFMELGMHCLCTRILEYNARSLHAFKRAGFKEEGMMRERIYKKGKYWNVVNVSILKDEYLSIIGSRKVGD